MDLKITLILQKGRFLLILFCKRVLIARDKLPFMFYEQIWLNDCPEDFKPVYYRRYVDDIFALFCSPDHLEKFTNYLNSKHKNIKFTYGRQ